MMTAKLWVPCGGSDTLMAGGTSLPSQVNSLGTGWPSENAGLVTVNAIAEPPENYGPTIDSCDAHLVRNAVETRA
jgi:hypothetical protein